ncbi:MAG TPA: hypothetical protein VLA43_00660 [Longimicrobiales bacterium]|nr:hypothetical protein [Longimicrobiales bacterium]
MLRLARRPRLPALPQLLLAILPLLPGALAAQGGSEPADPPEVVAEEFNRGFQSMAWAGLVQRLHPEALAHLRYAADILVQVDTTGYVLGTFLEGAHRDDYPRIPDDEVVRRVLAAAQTEAPGLLSSLVSRRTEVLGVVPEGQDRHVVYRIVALVQGARPQVRVMTLSQVGGRWRVRAAEDIEVLHTAIRGIPIPRIRIP